MVKVKEKQENKVKKANSSFNTFSSRHISPLPQWTFTSTNFVLGILLRQLLTFQDAATNAGMSTQAGG